MTIKIILLAVLSLIAISVVESSRTDVQIIQDQSYQPASQILNDLIKSDKKKEQLVGSTLADIKKQIYQWSPFSKATKELKNRYPIEEYCTAKQMLGTLKSDIHEAEVYNPLLIKSC